MRPPAPGPSALVGMVAAETTREMRRHPRAPYRTPVRIEVPGIGAVGTLDDIRDERERWQRYNHVVVAVRFKVTEKLGAAAFADVDRHRPRVDALGVKKTLEHETERDRIDVGDAKRPGYERARCRASTGTDPDLTRSGYVDDTDDGEEVVGESELLDIAWFTPAGGHMDDSAWANDEARAVMVFLNGSAIVESDVRGDPIVDDSFLLLFNGHYEETVFQLPPRDFGARWTAELDTDGQVPPGRALRARAKVTLAPRSCVLLTRPPEPAPQPDAASTSAPSRDSAR